MCRVVFISERPKPRGILLIFGPDKFGHPDQSGNGLGPVPDQSPISLGTPSVHTPTIPSSRLPKCVGCDCVCSGRGRRWCVARCQPISSAELAPAGKGLRHPTFMQRRGGGGGGGGSCPPQLDRCARARLAAFARGSLATHWVRCPLAALVRGSLPARCARARPTRCARALAARCPLAALAGDSLAKRKPATPPSPSQTQPQPAWTHGTSSWAQWQSEPPSRAS